MKSALEVTVAVMASFNSFFLLLEILPSPAAALLLEGFRKRILMAALEGLRSSTAEKRPGIGRSRCRSEIQIERITEADPADAFAVRAGSGREGVFPQLVGIGFFGLSLKNFHCRGRTHKTGHCYSFQCLGGLS